MYTPSRQDSVPEIIHRFTPSKRGQAALDALALGYDVQIPDHSFSFLPRSATSDRALTSIASTTPNTKRISKSTSYSEPPRKTTHQGSVQPASETSDRRRFARQVGHPSPHQEGVLYSSTKQDVIRPESPASTADSRPSTSSIQSDPPQYVLANPERAVGLTHVPFASASLQTPRSLACSPARDEYARRHSMSSTRTSPSKAPKREFDAAQTIVPQDFGHPYNSPAYDYPGFTPIYPPSGVQPRRLPDRAPKTPSLQIDTARFHLSDLGEPRSAPPMQYMQTRSEQSPFCIRSMHEPDERNLYRVRQQATAPAHHRHSISSAHPLSSHRAPKLPAIEEPRFPNSRRVPFQQPNLDFAADPRRYYDNVHRVSHGLHSSLSSSGPSSTGSARHVPPRLIHDPNQTSSTQSTSPRTPTSAYPELEDEVFRVHPERAAISRMESMLMLSACRNDVGPPWTQGHEVFGFGPGFSNRAKYASHRPQPNERPHDPPSHSRTRTGQRSGSGHMSSPRRYEFSRHRQRSASVTVQGLSPEAVKKLRVYETLKGRQGGSLREMVGCTLPVRTRGGGTQRPKPREAPPDLCSSAVAQADTTPIRPVSPCLTPTGVPLPPSPVSDLPLSPARVALPPSLDNTPLLNQSPVLKEPASLCSPLVASESFMKYHASQGIESPRPVRTRQNTAAVPTLRLITSPRKEASMLLDGGSRSDLPSSTFDSASLKADPAIERIITPPPSFWSPPPSMTIRTSAPLSSNRNSTSTRAPNALLPAAIVGPVRSMSVPPPGAGEPSTDDVRRAWSCDPPVSVDVRIGRSFAGDWNQSMIIEVSDDEDDMVTDVSSEQDESEPEDVPEQVEGVKGLRSARVRDVEDDDCRQAADTIEPDVAPKLPVVRGGLSPSLGSVIAVEAVQRELVKLAMDNTTLNSSKRTQAKPLATPPPSIGLVSKPTAHRHPSKQPLDPYIRSNHVQASINAYFDPPAVHTLNYPKSNPALESLRSGLEKRAAANVSAVKEAVRARSASPSLVHPLMQNTARAVSGPVLPPRLQRLQSMTTAWTSPSSKSPFAQLEIPPFSRASTSMVSPRDGSYLPSPGLTELLPGSVPQLSETLLAIDSPSSAIVQPSPLDLAPVVEEKSHTTASEAPVPPIPKAPPPTRSRRKRQNTHRPSDGPSPTAQSRTIADPSNTSSPANVPVQESAAPNSPQLSGPNQTPPTKSKWKNHRQNRAKKATATAAAKPAADPVPQTLEVISPTPTVADTQEIAPAKAPKKKRYYRKHKTHKPAAES